MRGRRRPERPRRRITVPGMGDVMALSPSAEAARCASSSMSGGGVGGEEGRLSRHGVRAAAGVRRSGSAESGGCSVRNAVVVSPARTDGWADEPAQERPGSSSRLRPRVSASAAASCVERLLASGRARTATRDDALDLLAAALTETKSGGNDELPFLRWLVGHPVMRAGEATTAFLTERRRLAPPQHRGHRRPGAGRGDSTFPRLLRHRRPNRRGISPHGPSHGRAR